MYNTENKIWWIILFFKFFLIKYLKKIYEIKSCNLDMIKKKVKNNHNVILFKLQSVYLKNYTTIKNAAAMLLKPSKSLICV